MLMGYQPPKFQQFDGKGNPKQHVAHFVETCNNARTYGDHLVKQFVRSLKGNAFDWAREGRAKQGNIAKFPLRNSSSDRAREGRAKQGKIAKFPLRNSSSARVQERGAQQRKIANNSRGSSKLKNIQKRSRQRSRLSSKVRQKS
ncbi:hypothetical protein Sango_1608500 [Sesamum angolense]|uniref:Uncharacterized protein n=1 Tax=Sesamum angolense TaxID=2727404 RepID=A0AAE1WJY0_9LAMI|nr:hypothetical protein Sango_1608500 [Sesamum angolense]